MKHLFLLLFLFSSVYTIAQYKRKGPLVYRYARVYVDIEDTAAWDIVPIYNYSVLFAPTTDTIVYELQEGDTVVLALDMKDEPGYFGDGFDFDVQVDYGIPLYPYGGPYPSWSSAHFTDSAQVTFCVNGDGVRTHMLKLTKKAAPQAEIPESVLQLPFAVYPNPSGDVLHIQSEAGCRFVVYGVDGKLVTEIGPDDSKTIDLTGFESGVYRISQVKDGTVLETLSFVRM